MRLWRWLFGRPAMKWKWGPWSSWHEVTWRSWSDPNRLPFALWDLRSHYPGEPGGQWSWSSSHPSVWVEVVS